MFKVSDKARNTVLIVFAVLMVVSLVFFYAPGRSPAVADPLRSPEAVASVGREEISVGKLATLKESYRQMFGGQFSMAQFGGDRRLLENLIRQRVVAQEAARLGLAASDAEVADDIRRTFRDPTTGSFVGFDRYKESVIGRYGSVEDYERQVRDQIAARKLEAFVAAGVRVSEDEVRENYRRQNTTFDLTYVPVAPDKLAARITPSDADLRAYFDSRQTDFRILEDQKKIRYVFIDQVKVGEKLEISDADLQTEYDQLSPENKQAGVRVQQIVLRVARPELDETVRAKADELVQKARGEDGNASFEEFAEIARGNSEDPTTAKAGGALAAPVRRSANKPDDPLQTTLSMTEGAVSDPIKYGNSYYVFRRGEAIPKSFADARQELLVSLRNRRSYAAAAQLAGRVAERLKENKDVAKTAADFAGEANMNVADMVRETPYVKPGDTVPEIGSAPQFEEAIRPLSSPNDVGDRVSVKGGFAIPLLVDKKDPRLPALEEVRDQVVERVRLEQAQARSEQTARDIIGGAQSAANLSAAAERSGLKAEVLNDYKLGAQLGDAGTSAALDEAIFALKAGETASAPIKVNDRWVIVGATKRTEADLAEFTKQRDQLTDSLLSQRRSQVYEDYVSAVQQKMERDGRIKIYDEALAQLRDEEPAIATPPQFPRGAGGSATVPVR